MFLFHIIVNSIYGKKRGTSLLMLEYIVVILTVCKNVGILLAKVHFLERNCQWRSKSDLHPEAYINCDAPNAINYCRTEPPSGSRGRVTGQGSGSQGSKALCRWKSFSCSMSNKSAKFLLHSLRLANWAFVMSLLHWTDSKYFHWERSWGTRLIWIPEKLR